MQKKHELTDTVVRRIVICLSDGKRRSLHELTSTYNKRYPPARFGAVFNLKMGDAEVEEILKLLVKEGLVTREPFSFTDRPQKDEVVQYQITDRGLSMPQSFARAM